MIGGGGYIQSSIKEGYGILLRYLEGQCLKNGVQILLNEEVRSIDISDKEAVVQTQNGNYFAGR